ncbi:MAG TPA: pyridoxal 5'-phosphate synthase glutaminase subunit PdxT [Spirochaetia bacterium]|nr:pyridoxal 5'-phosphate synthase glutaminase subunit PdxT [Spirochaetia bacterium]
MASKKIGILALQGDVEKHVTALHTVGGSPTLVRRPDDLAGVQGLVIPGGESTTIGKLLIRFGLFEPLGALIREGLPVYGTCAGMILLATKIVGYDQPSFSCLDVTVERNAYGPQVMSFEADLTIPCLGEKPVRAVFIRAPVIRKTGKNVTVLARFEDIPVLVREHNILASSFHPELTDEPRIHRYFLTLV